MNCLAQSGIEKTPQLLFSTHWCKGEEYLTHQLPSLQYLPQGKVMCGGVSYLAPFNEQRHLPTFSSFSLSCLRRSFHLRFLSIGLHIAQLWEWCPQELCRAVYTIVLGGIVQTNQDQTWTQGHSPLPDNRLISFPPTEVIIMTIKPAQIYNQDPNNHPLSF